MAAQQQESDRTMPERNSNHCHPDRITPDEIRTTASLTLHGVGRYLKDYVIVEAFGATPEILVLLWELIRKHLSRNSKPHHMLWWMYQCKHYPTKLLLEKALQVSPPTARRAMKPVKEAFLLIRTKVVSMTTNVSNRKLFFHLTSISTSFICLIHASSCRSNSKID